MSIKIMETNYGMSDEKGNEIMSSFVFSIDEKGDLSKIILTIKKGDELVCETSFNKKYFPIWNAILNASKEPKPKPKQYLQIKDLITKYKPNEIKKIVLQADKNKLIENYTFADVLTLARYIK